VTRTLTIPVAALHALRAAALGAPDGELRLRDAGYAAAAAMYDDFASYLQIGDPDAGPPHLLPFPRFAVAVSDYLEASGWGSAHIEAASQPHVVRVSSADWVEAERDANGPYPSCHFTTGLLAGFFGRVAGEPLAVLETSCRSTGAERCEFSIGSRAVMEAVWERSRTA